LFRFVDRAHVRLFAVWVGFAGTEVIVSIRGEVDLLTAPELGAIVGSMIAGGHRSLVLDLAACDFMDASGLGVIADAMSRLKSTGGVLTIRSPSPLVVRMLDITGLDTMPVIEGSGPVPGHLGPEQIDGAPALRLRAERMGSGRLGQVRALAVDDGVVDGALKLVVAPARSTAGGADGVSVSLRRHGRLATVAASDQTISDMDADQYATGEGPCVDASVQGRWFHAENLDTETRWPAFTPRAWTLGINAILSSPLVARDQPVGALNIYSRTAVAFAPKDQELASTFASEASEIMAVAGLDASDDELASALHQAEEARRTIALAQGVIMERDGIHTDSAYIQLLKFSQWTSRPLRERAEDVVVSTRRSDHDQQVQSAEPGTHDG